MKIFYLVKKELIEIFRQKELLFLIFVAPLVQIVLLSYVITTDIKNVPIEIINLSRARSARQIVTRIRTTPLFRVRRISDRPDDALERLKRGEVKAVILLRDRRRTLPEGSLAFPEIQIQMDGIDSNTSQIAAGYFNGIIRTHLLNDLERRGLSMPVRAQTIIRFNPELRSINTMGPAIVALLLTIVTLFLTSQALVREKEQQTLDTLRISRLSTLEIFVGKALPQAIIGITQMLLGLIVIILWFGIPLRGSVLSLFVAAFIYLSAILSYGLLISTLSSTQQQAMFFSWFSLMSFLILSGFLTPVENIPMPLRLLSDINPLRYLMQIIREIFLKGNGIEFFWKELLALSAITTVMTSISLVNFKRFVSK
jgi:ABC-2 type transport system permease protein